MPHRDSGVRVALFRRISPLSEFVAAPALVLMQRELERGNDLALMLDESAWAHLACLPEPAAVLAVARALPFGSCRNAPGANGAVCAISPVAAGHPASYPEFRLHPAFHSAFQHAVQHAAYLHAAVHHGAFPVAFHPAQLPATFHPAQLPVPHPVPVPHPAAFRPAQHPKPPEEISYVPAPSRRDRRHAAPDHACENRPPGRWESARKEVAALVRMCNGAIDAADVRPVATRLEALGPALAARVVRETGIRVLSENLRSKDAVLKSMRNILKQYEF